MVFGLRKSLYQRNSLISFLFLVRKGIYKSSGCVIMMSESKGYAFRARMKKHDFGSAERGNIRGIMWSYG